MNIGNNKYKTVWMKGESVYMIDQTKLPFDFDIYESENYRETCKAIKSMIIRGAGAIGAAAGYAMAQAALEAERENTPGLIDIAKNDIENTRPTARNLFYAVKRVHKAAKISAKKAVEEAYNVAKEDIEASRRIGQYGAELLKDNTTVLTHCNAGWLAFVDYGTALSPVYTAKDHGKNIFVYVDETRPRSQGAKLTAWELKNENIDYAIIPDNAAAFLMWRNKIDIVITGADRIAKNGDVANKIGTLEKAIAASFHNIPFYIAAPVSTIDFLCNTGSDIKIEEREPDEVLYQSGPDEDEIMRKILVCSPGSKVCNPSFDVTPANLITGIITEKGIIKPGDISKFE